MSLPWETSKGRQGGEWLHSPLSFASPHPQGAALTPKPHTGNKPQGDGVLLQGLCLPSSKSAQGAGPHLGPHPGPCLQTLQVVPVGITGSFCISLNRLSSTSLSKQSSLS